VVELTTPGSAWAHFKKFSTHGGTMSYIGIAFALYYVLIGFECALKPRPAGSVVYRNPFLTAAIGMIHGVCLLIATLGLFVWLGASLPVASIMWLIVVASMISMTLYYWKPVVMAINRYHGVKVGKFIEV